MFRRTPGGGLRACNVKYVTITVFIDNHIKIITFYHFKPSKYFLFTISKVQTFVYISAYIYWAKVLPEQGKLFQTFRTHEIFRKSIKMLFDQAIIHLSKSLNFIIIKFLQITSFVKVLEVPTQNVRLQK